MKKHRPVPIQPSIEIPQGKAIMPSRFQLAWDAVDEDPIVRENLKLRSELMIAIDESVRQKRLTQTEVAEKLGVSQPRVSALLKGKINDFRLDALVSFAFRMGLRVNLQVTSAYGPASTMKTSESTKERSMSESASTIVYESYTYVCYASTDADVVHGEISWLQQQGLKLWYDGSLDRDEIKPESIANAIESAARVLYYVSKASLASDFCRREMEYARLRGAVIVRVILEELDPTTQGAGGGQDILLDAVRDDSYREHLLAALV